MSLSTSPGRLASPALAVKRSKKDVKAEITAHVKNIADSVKLITYFTEKLKDVKRGQKMVIPLKAGGSVEISHADIRAHQKATISQIKALPKYVVDKTRSRRGTGAARNAGFNKIVQLTDEMVNFFATANLGPRATGEVRTTVTAAGKPKTEVKNAVALAGTDLRTSLSSFLPTLANGQANPVYRIIQPGTFPSIHAIYVYNNGMAIPGSRGYLRVSDVMRSGLRQTLANTIQGDVDKVAKKYGVNSAAHQDAQRTGQMLVNTLASAPSVNDANYKREFKVGDVVIFNPNYYKYAHASKIINRGGVPLDAAALAQVGAAAQATYGKSLIDVLKDEHLEAYKAGGLAREARKESDKLAKQQAAALKRASK